MGVIDTFYEAGAEVGKGGIWDPETKNYYYVDITGKTIHEIYVPTFERKGRW